jgi:hypothetical protein
MDVSCPNTVIITMIDGYSKVVGDGRSLPLRILFSVSVIDKFNWWKLNTIRPSARDAFHFIVTPIRRVPC